MWPIDPSAPVTDPPPRRSRRHVLRLGGGLASLLALGACADPDPTVPLAATGVPWRTATSPSSPPPSASPTATVTPSPTPPPPTPIPAPTLLPRPAWPDDVLRRPAYSGPTDRPLVGLTIDDGWSNPR